MDFRSEAGVKPMKKTLKSLALVPVKKMVGEVTGARIMPGMRIDRSAAKPRRWATAWVEGLFVEIVLATIHPVLAHFFNESRSSYA